MQSEGCNLAWWGLAGIGRIESDHGRVQDAHLLPNGDLLPPIIGVALTGAHGTALITDSTGGYAHAEGPMQFIPSTWAKWGTDATGAGTKDPNNIYDASLAAADYLCDASTNSRLTPGSKRPTCPTTTRPITSPRCWRGPTPTRRPTPLV